MARFHFNNKRAKFVLLMKRLYPRMKSPEMYRARSNMLIKELTKYRSKDKTFKIEPIILAIEKQIELNRLAQVRRIERFERSQIRLKADLNAKKNIENNKNNKKKYRRGSYKDTRDAPRAFDGLDQGLLDVNSTEKLITIHKISRRFMHRCSVDNIMAWLRYSLVNRSSISNFNFNYIEDYDIRRVYKSISIDPNNIYLSLKCPCVQEIRDKKNKVIGYDTNKPCETKVLLHQIIDRIYEHVSPEYKKWLRLQEKYWTAFFKRDVFKKQYKLTECIYCHDPVGYDGLAISVKNLPNHTHHSSIPKEFKFNLKKNCNCPFCEKTTNFNNFEHKLKNPVKKVQDFLLPKMPGCTPNSFVNSSICLTCHKIWCGSCITGYGYHLIPKPMPMDSQSGDALLQPILPTMNIPENKEFDIKKYHGFCPGCTNLIQVKYALQCDICKDLNIDPDLECIHISCVCNANLSVGKSQWEHFNITCNTVRKINTLRHKGFVYCPGCNLAINKIDGCNHITCSGCKMEFCYICGASYSQGCPHQG
jgi:hypothetical protein